MALALTKRVANGAPLSNAQHDANLTAIEGAVNTNETNIAAVVAEVDVLQDTGVAGGSALNSQFEGIVSGKQTVDWDNVVNKPASTDAVYAFRAKKSTAAQTVAGNSSAIISMDAEDFDTATVFDLVSSTFTAVVAGYYQFNYSVQVAQASGTPTDIGMVISLRVDGSPKDQWTMDDEVFVIAKGSTLLLLDAGDVVDLHIDITQTGVGDWEVADNGDNTAISGFLVQAT